MDDMTRANYYWAYQKARVEWIAAQHGVALELDGCTVLEIFDGGEIDYTDEALWVLLKNEFVLREA